MLIPTLNASPLLNGSEEERMGFSLALVESLKHYGFIKLRGHSIPSDSIQQAFEWNRRFFALPTIAKRCLRHNGSGPPRGYSSPGQERLWLRSVEGTANAAEAQEMREHFDIGPFSDTDFPTPWLGEADLGEFRKFMGFFYAECQSLSLALAEAIELGTGAPSAALRDRCSPAGSEIRLNYYPPVLASDVPSSNVRRIWPHTDVGTFTLLWQEGTGGLQLEDRHQEGVFHSIGTTDKNEIILNVADSLERWTNGLLQAAVHQVKLPIGQNLPERRSVVFFFKPSKLASIAPVDYFVREPELAKYPDLTFIEYTSSTHDSLYQKNGITDSNK